jgi:hypothetical protein
MVYTYRLTTKTLFKKRIFVYLLGDVNLEWDTAQPNLIEYNKDMGVSRCSL